MDDDDDYDSKITRINAHLARRMGEMLVTRSDFEIEEPHETLLELGELDARQIVREYEARQARFGTTPFDPDGHVLRLFPGGVTIWSGFPGAGKTTILRQLICHILKRGSSVFVATLEEDPRDALVRIAMTASGRTSPEADDVAWFMDAYTERFRLWGVIGIARHLNLLATIRELAKQGIRHAVIDSLMCLDVANDDFESQRQFANLLATTARAAKIHIHLVAHPRKLISSDQEPDLNDIAGAREIGGVADNVLFIRRVKDKAEYSARAEVTPMCVSIRKQRHFQGAITDITGYFNRTFRQFTTDQWTEKPTWYLPEEARK